MQADDIGVSEATLAQRLRRIEQLAPVRLQHPTLKLSESDEGDDDACAAPTRPWSPFAFSDLCSAVECWRGWADIAESDEEIVPVEAMQSFPAGAIKLEYASKFRLPIWDDLGGSYIAVDFDPGPAGQVGQVISCGSNDCEQMAVFGDSVTGFLRNVEAMLQTSNVEQCCRHHLSDVLREHMYTVGGPEDQ